jgi:hypothetical protein
MNVINTEQQPGIPEETTITRPVTTVSDLPRELFTVDDYYREGYSILLRHPNYQGGVKEIYKPAEEDSPEERIPVRYDWEQSGFWIDYELSTPERSSKQHSNTVMSSKFDMAQIPSCRSITSKKEFHNEYGHLGSVENCDIWVMDTVTWSHRDNDGSKYMVVQDEVRSCIPKPRILDCAEWKELENEFEFRTIAERACGVVEVATKAILMQQNLPPQWWVRAAHQAVWLLNRFPSSRGSEILGACDCDDTEKYSNP